MEICGRVFKERETPDSRAGGQFPLPVFLLFFLRSFSSFSCLTPVFVCGCNTDVLMTAYKRRLQICSRGGSAAGGQQASGSSSISTMADAEAREEQEKKKMKCMIREREREREMKQTKASCSCQSHVALPVFLSPVDEQESTLTNHDENKTETPLPPFQFDQPRQAIIPCELT